LSATSFIKITMGKNYRWGVIGAGRIADKFCTALNFVDGSELYAVASRDGVRAKAYADKFNASKYFDNYDALIRDENIDIIYIATPNVFHHELALACMQQGKAVLCEKPLSINYRLSKQMTEQAKESGVFLMEGMWTSCMPFIEKIQQLIQEDVIGIPQYVAADFGFTAPVDFESRLFSKALGGGSLLDIGIYPVFLATLILGEPSAIQSVSKLTATGVDEYCNLVFEYPQGQTAHLLSTISFSTAIEAEISGPKGRIVVQNPWFKATDFSVILNDGTKQQFSIPHASNGFEHEIKEVMHCLDNGLLQSNRMPHQLTLSISKIMEEVLKKAGVVF
jgi:predicted dehydrogenase